MLAAAMLLLVLGGRSAPGFGCALVALVLILAAPARPTSEPLGDGDLRVTQLDVGQGTAILVETRNYRLLYDTGPGEAGGFSAGSQMIAPFLRQRGISGIDDVVVSHADLDHAGGIAGLRDWITVDRWIVGRGVGALDRTRQLPCHHQLRWQRDSVVFEVLSPSMQDRHLDGNDHSCVLLVRSLRAPGQGVLLSGDIERAGEFGMLEQHRDELSSAIVSVPHHGSKTSSSYALLGATGAEYALLSAGHNNRYGHPASEVLDRYRQLGIKVLDSARLGAVELQFRDGQWHGPYCARYRRQRAWLGANGTAAVQQRCIAGIQGQR